MRWFSDMEGYFFTWSCPEDQKVRCALNLLHFGAKDWWKLVTSSYSPFEMTIVNWGKFTKIFCAEYMPLVVRERLTQEYLSLRQTMESVMQITKKFTKRALFCQEYASSKKVKMS